MDHEYSVLGGLNRAAIGRYLSIAASIIASAIGASIVYLIDVARSFGFAEQIPSLVLWPLTAGAIYAGLYWFFERKAWRSAFLSKLLKVPNLAGTWKCEGKSLAPGESEGLIWSGEITIVQSWDKLRIRLATAQSGSNSIAAALLYDEAAGYHLLYNYKNDPRIGETELNSHRGSAELLFSADLKSAEGEYFNGHGRYTFGTLKLTRLTET